MKRTFKYRLYPNLEQREALSNIFNFCRFLYNSALEERISYYKTYGKSRTLFDQINFLPEIKKMFPTEASSIHSQILQQVLAQLDSAYKNFFRKVKAGSAEPGFPRFKNSNRFRSICFPQIKPDLISGKGGGVKRLPNDKLKISGLPGEFKVVWHRPLQGRCKQARLIKDGEQYFISFSCEAVSKTPHPKPYKTSKEKLAFLNRKLSLKQKVSQNRKKAVVALQRQHLKVKNIREDFQHKLANDLIRKNDVIILEKLNIKKMQETRNFLVSKANIADASWGNFVAKLIYKAESAGRLIIQVDPRNTSSMCSSCGNIKDSMLLSDREYHCEVCDLTIDRDVNAALNIRERGTRSAEYKAYKVFYTLQKPSALC